jgi:2-keto-4-pentenoate hydratase/2-oxohepta-3-ene-1,7-dioic acid hydratase in catechol pathway
MSENTLRLVSYADGAGYRLGALAGGGLVDLQRASGGRLPTDLVELIRAGQAALAVAREVVAGARPVPLDGVRLGPPVPAPPRNAFAVGRNYAEHIAETARGMGVEAQTPQRAVFFSKPASALIGPYDDLELDEEATAQLDYEVELTLVIGRPGRNIAVADAMDHVFGYTVGNDVTARDLQSAHVQWHKGKSLDRTSAVGPCVVPTADLDAGDLRLSLTVNGEPRQDSRTSMMIFSIATIVSQLSRGMTLEPGDLVMTGTPEGIGHRMSPPRYLRPGDVVEATVEGIGTIRNEVVAYKL